MKYYLIFGPPGAGKGTHAGVLAQRYNLKHISTGALLRAEIAAGTPLGKQAEVLIDDGRLVPDEIVEAMIQNAFDTIKDVDGFLLDGYPRTIPQAEALDVMLSRRGEKLTGVISIMIPDEVVHERIQGRAKVDGRADDADDEIINHRIATYHSQTEPLIAFYRNRGLYHEVKGYPGSIEEIRQRVIAVVDTI